MTEPDCPRTIALYGGSFNPPHIGHLVVISYVLATQPVEAVWLMPCFQHAFGKSLAPFEHRMEMARRLTAGVIEPGRAAVTDVESQIGGESRTIDTIKHLRAQYPEVTFDLIVGTDIFQERAAWKNFDELESLCRFIVIGRRGSPAPKNHVTSPPLIDISSTELRERLAKGLSTQSLLPASVAAYIHQESLVFG